MPSVLDSNRAAETRLDILPTKQKSSNSGKMSMASINFWLDAALLVNMIFILWVSAMLQVVFPPPTEATGWTLWGLSFNELHRVQFISLCVFSLLAVEHIVLHWNWVCSVLATHILRLEKRPDEASQAVYGVGAFIVIFTIVMATLLAAMIAVRPQGL